MHLAAFGAVLIPTVIASWLERCPLASYGLPWRQALGARFWEGTAWGVGVTILQVGVLQASRSISFHLAGLNAQTALACWGRWAFTMLAVALFEECLKRGYLQFVLSRSMGFWPAAIFLGSLFGLEKLLVADYRNVIAFMGVVLYALLMCLTLRLTGSLWFAIGFHSALEWSAVYVFGISTPILRNPHGTLLTPVLQGPAWITGGQSGLAASILTPVTFILVWIVFRYRFRQRTILAEQF